MNMSIEEAKVLKEETESKILELLNEFESSTGLDVTDVRLERESTALHTTGVTLRCVLR